MEITDLKVKEKNSIVVSDSLKAPIIKLSVSLDSETTIPNSNDLIIYVGKNKNSDKKEYTYTLNKPLSYLDNVSDEFILSPKLNGDKIDLKAYVIRRIEDSVVLEEEVIEEFFYEPIILDEKENYITTNYTNAILEIVYPKDTDIVNYFLSNTMYKEGSNSLTLDDIYFKDAFTKADEGINANFNRVNLNCFKLNDSPFGMDALGNLTVNSLITVDNPSGESNLNFDKIYPIGSIYMSVVDTNPQALFGGSWESFATGRTLVGIDTSQDEFNTVMKIGGSKYLQKHKHNIINLNQATTFSKSGTGYAPSQSSGDRAWKNIDNNDITVDEVGTGEAGNLQPYITVYMWKRIA